MGIEQTIKDDLDAARRGGDEPRRRCLTLLRAALKNAAIDAGRAAEGLDDEAALAVLQRQAKQRRDSIAQYAAGGREDLVAEERAELAIVESYLPPQLGEAEIEAAARAVMAEVGASSPTDMGRVMGPLMGRLQGRADGRAVGAVVRRLLAADGS